MYSFGINAIFYYYYSLSRVARVGVSVLGTLVLASRLSCLQFEYRYDAVLLRLPSYDTGSSQNRYDIEYRIPYPFWSEKQTTS